MLALNCSLLNREEDPQAPAAVSGPIHYGVLSLRILLHVTGVRLLFNNIKREEVFRQRKAWNPTTRLFQYLTRTG
jgi:hypothetical protein